jgi:hypothetical protein
MTSPAKPQRFDPEAERCADCGFTHSGLIMWRIGYSTSRDLRYCVAALASEVRRLRALSPEERPR